MSIFSRTKAINQEAWSENHPDFGLVSFSRNRKYRQLRLSVVPFQGLQVKIPNGFTKRNVQLFLKQKSSWILGALDQVRQTEQISRQFYAEQPSTAQSEIRKSLFQRLDHLADFHNFNYNKVSLRDQKSRWGSCSAKNNISLNQKLFYLPDHLRDYVLIHELAHTLQKNHSKKFWDIVNDRYGKGETKLARAELKTFEFLFYPPPNQI
mgnify:CR=1 FL=1